MAWMDCISSFQGNNNLLRNTDILTLRVRHIFAVSEQFFSGLDTSSRDLRLAGHMWDTDIDGFLACLDQLLFHRINSVNRAAFKINYKQICIT